MAINGNLDEAISQGLKGLEYCKKTDANWIQGALYGLISGYYSNLGKLKQAEDYLLKASELSKQYSQWHVIFATTTARGAFLAAKGQFDQSNKVYEEILGFLETYKMRALEGDIRLVYSMNLQKLGLVDEARVQFDKGQKLLSSLIGQVEAEFGHTYLQLSLLLPSRVPVNEEFEMRVEVVNTSKEQGFLQKLEGVIPSGLNCIHLPSFCSLVSDSIVSNNEKIGPFEVVTIKLKLKASKTGIYHLTPKLSYADGLCKTKTCDSEPIDLTVEVVKQPFEVLAGRVTAGTFELDRLLMGGIPEKYAVMLAAPSCDERELLIERFLEAGATTGETAFYITAETGNTKALAEKYPSNFYLFVCNPQADVMIQNLPNVYKLKGVENLTDIDIALNKAFRTLKTPQETLRRICIEIVSDVLLQHHAVNTRRWLSALLPTLKSKGFTILAVVDPSMHPLEELQAVLSVFDGEIRVAEKETPEGTKQVMKVRKLVNQKYSDKEVILDKEKLAA